jgi:hypothetical protein
MVEREVRSDGLGCRTEPDPMLKSIGIGWQTVPLKECRLDRADPT